MRGIVGALAGALLLLVSMSGCLGAAGGGIEAEPDPWAPFLRLKSFSAAQEESGACAPFDTTLPGERDCIDIVVSLRGLTCDPPQLQAMTMADEGESTSALLARLQALWEPSDVFLKCVVAYQWTATGRSLVGGSFSVQVLDNGGGGGDHCDIGPNNECGFGEERTLEVAFLRPDESAVAEAHLFGQIEWADQVRTPSTAAVTWRLTMST